MEFYNVVTVNIGIANRKSWKNVFVFLYKSVLHYIYNSPKQKLQYNLSSLVSKNSALSTTDIVLPALRIELETLAAVTRWPDLANNKLLDIYIFLANNNVVVELNSQRSR